MAERRTIDPDNPGIVEIEIDEGLEGTRCAACQVESRSRLAPCPHGETQRAQAIAEEATQQVAALVGRTPLPTLLAIWRKALNLRPWWATAEGRARVRAEWEEERAKREKTAAPPKGDDGDHL